MELYGYIFFGVITIAISVFIFKKRLRSKQLLTAEEEVRVSRLAADLRAGGAGLVGGGGRVQGVVHVYVSGDGGGCVGVCVCSSIQVMYWWRVVMGNGHSVSIPGLATDNVPARAAVAAIRLWGNMWSNADTVIIHLDTLEDDLVKRRLKDQVEDCQNKFGVRVRLVDGDSGGEQEDGGHDLCVQLLGGGGVGQHEAGWHNTNLRMVGDTVHQLVDHTSKLSSHYFEI